MIGIGGAFTPRKAGSGLEQGCYRRFCGNAVRVGERAEGAGPDTLRQGHRPIIAGMFRDESDVKGPCMPCVLALFFLSCKVKLRKTKKKKPLNYQTVIMPVVHVSITTLLVCVVCVWGRSTCTY